MDLFWLWSFVNVTAPSVLKRYSTKFIHLSISKPFMNCSVFLKLLNSICSLVGSRHPCGRPEWAAGSPVPVNLLCAKQPLVGTSLRSHRSMSPQAGASGSSSVPTLMVSSVFPHCKYEEKKILWVLQSATLKEGLWKLLKVHQIFFPSNEVTGGIVYGL